MADEETKKTFRDQVNDLIPDSRSTFRRLISTPLSMMNRGIMVNRPDNVTDTGINERYEEDDPYNRAQARTYPGFLGQKPTINYYYGMQSDPAVVEHERMHAGQLQLRNPNLSDIQNIFDPENPGFKAANPVLEAPAYGLSQTPFFGTSQGSEALKNQRFALYMKKMRELNPDRSYIMEANSPESLEKNYLKTVPPPYPNPRPRELR